MLPFNREETTRGCGNTIKMGLQNAACNDACYGGNLMHSMGMMPDMGMPDMKMPAMGALLWDCCGAQRATRLHMPRLRHSVAHAVAQAIALLPNALLVCVRCV